MSEQPARSARLRCCRDTDAGLCLLCRLLREHGLDVGSPETCPRRLVADLKAVDDLTILETPLNEREAYRNIEQALSSELKSEKQALVAAAGCSGFGDLLSKWLEGDPRVREVVETRARARMREERNEERLAASR